MRNEALSDLDAVELYDEALGEILPDCPRSWQRIIGELRWQYVKSNPKIEENTLKCFKACLYRDDLDHARQVSLAYQVNQWDADVVFFRPLDRL